MGSGVVCGSHTYAEEKWEQLHKQTPSQLVQKLFRSDQKWVHMDARGDHCEHF